MIWCHKTFCFKHADQTFSPSLCNWTPATSFCEKSRGEKKICSNKSPRKGSDYGKQGCLIWSCLLLECCLTHYCYITLLRHILFHYLQLNLIKQPSSRLQSIKYGNPETETEVNDVPGGTTAEGRREREPEECPHCFIEGNCGENVRRRRRGRKWDGTKRGNVMGGQEKNGRMGTRGSNKR